MSELDQPQVALGASAPSLISEEEAAKMLGKSRQWLRNLRLDGEGPMYVDMGNTVRYYPDDVTEWLHSRRKKPAKQQRKAKAAPAAKKKAAAPRKTASPTTKVE